MPEFFSTGFPVGTECDSFFCERVSRAHFEGDSSCSSACMEFSNALDRIVQRDRSEHGSSFSCRNIAYKRQSSVCETGMINGKHRVQHFISRIGGDDRIVICRINFMDVFLCFLSGCPFCSWVRIILRWWRISCRRIASLWLLIFTCSISFLHGLKLHFTKIAVLRYLLFILIFLKVDDEKYQVGNAECKSHELNNCFISGIK